MLHYSKPAAILVLAIFLVSLFAPQLAPYDPQRAVDGQESQPPSLQHVLGTDSLGRDVLSRVLWGGRQTLSIGFAAVAVILLVGLSLGGVASLRGGGVARAILSVTDALFAIPPLLTAMALLAVLGRGHSQVAVAVGIAGLPSYVRIVYTLLHQVQRRPFLDSARVNGTGAVRIFTHYLWPNVQSGLLSALTVSLAWSLLSVAALSYLGFAGDPSLPEWGSMLAENRIIIRLAPLASIMPGLALVLTLMCINWLADSFSDAIPTIY